ncbi:MAG: tryptophan synthase subunit alpha [Burkholderiales bacterium]
MSRIEQTFSFLAQQKRKALIPFFTAGDPAPEYTVPMMHGLVEAGADIIELGVPFSDPMADGPTIQRSSERALKQGVNLPRILQDVAEFRRTNQTTPVVLMGYLNPIERMGYAKFAEAAQHASIDGVLVVDYPPEEAHEFVLQMRQHKLECIFLLSPTSSTARINAVAQLASGYIYYVSLKGVTGAATIDLSDVAKKIPQIKNVVRLPVGVGFGIRDGATARAVAQIADAVVIGSRIVQEIENSQPQSAVANVTRLVKQFRAEMDKT